MTTCPGCGLELSATGGAHHAYYHASAECWGLFGEVLAVQYADVRLFSAAHQLTVDAYAAQHPGGEHPDKSVALHLVGLALVLEEGWAPTRVAPELQRLASEVGVWPRLSAPADLGPLTIADVALADDHPGTVRAWAEQVWAGWSAHHGDVRRLRAG